MVGKRIKVYWPLDEAWYEGSVQNFNGSKHEVLYDDGEVEWLNLGKEAFRILSDKQKGGQKRKKAVILSDDEEEEAGKASSGGESDYKAEEESDADSDIDLEDEAEAEENSEDEDDVEPSGSKRKRPSGARKSASGKTSKEKPSSTATPAVTGKGKGKDASRTPLTPLTAPGSNPTTPVTTPATGLQSARSTTPQSGARSAMYSAFDITPASDAKSGPVEDVELIQGLHPSTALSGEGARFLARMSSRFPFLHPNKIMDDKKRRPDDPDYNPRTLCIPTNWFRDAKVSDGQQQWWTFKAQNFDSVLLFKMGKFYEMFEMDAYVGVDVLGLSFMKGEQPHAGFPESAYSQMAEALARAGHRVVVIEQTETPDQLRLRNEERKRNKQKAESVVRREKVAVLSKGTLMDAQMVAAKPDAAYVMAVAELPMCTLMEEDEEQPTTTTTTTAANKHHVTRIGLCVVDVAAAQVLVGEFNDDEIRSQLRTQLTALQPVELVLPSEPLTATTQRVLKAGLREPRINTLHGSAGEWSVEKTIKKLQFAQYFGDATGGGAFDCGASWPTALAALAAQPYENAAALAALGGMVAFLQDALLDRAVLPLGRIEALSITQQQQQQACVDGESSGPQSMLLNGAALENLELMENGLGGTAGTLLAVLDHCCTPFGRRRLKQWLCRPLYRAADITARQDAVQDLIGPAAECGGQARKKLQGVSDLERALARLHASTIEGAVGREAAHVVLYEDAARRKVKGLVAAIDDLQAVVGAVQELSGALPECGSALLQQLLAQHTTITNTRASPEGETVREEVVVGWEAVEKAVSELANATDWKEAANTGRVVPAEGIDEAYDAAKRQVSRVQADLKAYLADFKKTLGGGGAVKDVAYITLGKDTYVLEVPDCLEKKVPRDFDLVGHRKGFKRYSHMDLKEQVKSLEEAQEAAEQALGHILQALIHKFVANKALWMWAVACVAELDALMSLAAHCLNSAVAMCRPQFVEPKLGQTPLFVARQLCHPAGIAGRDGSFVPNNINLGGESPSFLVLTGPNMGGKSTLLRQVCLAVVLAQVGAWVPAAALQLTPVDAVFVRMGAKDHIMTGQSTFFVELSETGAMLSRATPRSLVALDELGRGTATLDGAAIAAAVLDHMSHEIGCRGLFATHYHHLSHTHAHDPKVAIMHMACAVDGEEEDVEMVEGAEGHQPPATSGAATVTFLYQLRGGSCPKSYGTNVARLAGLPASVVARAAQISQEKETKGHAADSLAARQQRAAEHMQTDALQLEASKAAALAAALESCRGCALGECTLDQLQVAWQQVKQAAHNQE